jgi:hypothetical protein
MAEFRMLAEHDAEGTTKRVYNEILKVKHLRKVPNFFQTLANSTSGRRSSHAARSGVLWQLAASPLGILSAMAFIVAASPAAPATSRRWRSPARRVVNG